MNFRFSSSNWPRLQHWLYILPFALTSFNPVHAATFIGTNTGSIPDNNVNGRDVTFDVQGMANPIGKVEIKLTLSHNYMGDLKATLISPNGTARLILFGRTAYNDVTGLASADLSNTGIYTFKDDAPGDWWAAATVAETAQPAVMPHGAYRTSVVLSK